MKLLDRKIISNDFVLQKKAQIDEGVIIARKVDVLRETLASLEKQHRDFIAGTRQDLLNATSQLINEKESLQGEIRSLNERRQKLLKPLDDEWETLQEEKNKFFKEQTEFSIKEHDLNERESKITKTEKTISKIESQLQELKFDAERQRDEATTDRAVAKGLRKENETTRDTQARDFTRRTKDLDIRDRANNNQRKYLDDIKKGLEDREIELNNKERAIADKYAQLERTIKRIKNDNS